jgi:thiol-disulfide isomerase/thioredoxin
MTRMKRWKGGLLTAALVTISGALSFKAWDVLVRQPDLAEEAFEITRLSIPAPAPDFRLETRDGKPFSLADAKGQVLFVNFWATWCPPCREEMPSMLALGYDLERQYPGKFKMVAVSVDEGWDPIQQFFGGPPPNGILVGLDRDQLATRAYYCAARGGCPGNYKFPESYIVDRQGRLVAFVIGPRDWSEPAPRRFLQRLIGG